MLQDAQSSGSGKSHDLHIAAAGLLISKAFCMPSTWNSLASPCLKRPAANRQKNVRNQDRIAVISLWALTLACDTLAPLPVNTCDAFNATSHSSYVLTARYGRSTETRGRRPVRAFETPVRNLEAPHRSYRFQRYASLDLRSQKFRPSGVIAKFVSLWYRHEASLVHDLR